jgi:hypothetical protein
MADTKSLEELIQKTKKDRIITGGVEEGWIGKMEAELGLTLPESYKWFLRTYGQCGVAGVMIYGIARNNTLRAALVTEEYREQGLPPEYVVILDVDDWIYCLDTSQKLDGECPVVEWDREIGTGSESYPDFPTFFAQKIREALDQ